MKWLQAHKTCGTRVGTAALLIAFAVIACPANAADLARLRNGFTIRHEHRQVLGEMTRLYLGSDNSSYIDVKTAEIEGFERDFSLPPQEEFEKRAVGSTPTPVPNLPEIVSSASAARHLDPDLVNSVIHAESAFNSHAVSPKGAQGLMQLMPSTAGQLGVKNAFDPEANVDGGTQYLRQLLEQYNFDLVKALAAYNAGPQRVDKYRGVPPYRETQAYVARIVREYNKKKVAEEKQAAQQKQVTHQSGKQVPQPPTSTPEVQSAR
jgi:soluble lytic murein transglycosylase-like protein